MLKHTILTSMLVLGFCTMASAQQNVTEDISALTSLALGHDVFEGLKPFPKAAVFKVLGASLNGGTCNGAAPGSLTSGLGIWKGDAGFMPSTLSAGELNRLTTGCGALHPVANICPVCRA